MPETAAPGVPAGAPIPLHGPGESEAPRSFLWPRRKLNPTERREDVLRRPSFRQLVESMRETGGNTVPVFVSKPDADGFRDLLDGNGRDFAAEELGQEELLAIEAPDGLDKPGLIRFGVTNNAVRRTMQPEELGDKIDQYMRLTGCTQEEAARLFFISASLASRALATLLLPERHKEAASKLSPSARKLLAVIKDQEMLDKAMDYATRPRPDGSLPPYSDVALAIKRLKDDAKGGRKARPKEEIKPKDSPIASLVFYADIDAKLLLRELKAITTLIEANVSYGPDAIAAILRSKDKFAATPPA